MAFVSTSTEIALIDARSNSGSITLPLTTDIPGRIITIKDAYGACYFSSVTIFTQGADLFEDGTNQKRIEDRFGNLTFFTGSTSRWYITGGTEQDSFTANSLTVSSIWTYNWPALDNLANYGTTRAPGPLGQIALLDNIFTSSVASAVSSYVEFGNLNALQANTLGCNAFRWLIGVERNVAAASNGLDFVIKKRNALASTNPYGSSNVDTVLNINRFGNIGINNTNPTYTLDVNGIGRFSTLYVAPTTGTGAVITFSSFGTAAQNIRFALATGDAYKPTGTTWLATSDLRIKENITIADLDICYKNIKDLPLRRFTYTSTFIGETELLDKRVIGFIAQEVSTIMPKAVIQTGGYGIPDLLSLNVDQLNMTLFGAVKKAIQDKEALESTTFSLQTLNHQLTSRMSTLEGIVLAHIPGGNL
jgi:hypothetical protein